MSLHVTSVQQTWTLYYSVKLKRKDDIISILAIFTNKSFRKTQLYVIKWKGKNKSYLIFIHSFIYLFICHTQTTEYASSYSYFMQFSVVFYSLLHGINPFIEWGRSSLWFTPCLLHCYGHKHGSGHECNRKLRENFQISLIALACMGLPILTYLQQLYLYSL